ncbi:hypothetical protein B0H66DRAFT_623189 [Apodospora peruviana]|uniref:Uncharacterized protein n=1 Tax=Apodospora peruviana TaxID=516989 RepID=A0AAE0I5H7_9PEZI|nr:hypothetical protein B0H66DRAFT_623189 [Apodospora peruviana]
MDTDSKQFATLRYPPLYDPNLTLNSRRFLRLSPYSSSRVNEPEEPLTRPLDTAHGLEQRRSLEITRRRPRSASSTFSNLGSEHQHEHDDDEDDHTILGVDTASPPMTAAHRQRQLQTCPGCYQHYLVEVTNYPALQNPKVRRRQLLARGEYDAVLLVYDVGNRDSFAAIPDLHAEIPLLLRNNSKRHKDKWRLRPRRTRGGGGTGGRALRKSRSLGIFASGSQHHSPSRDTETGTGETVVALIGNKSDFDDEEEEDYFSWEQHHLLEKEAVLQEADVEERSLVHPLYRESRVFDLPDTSPPLSSPRSVHSLPVGRRSLRRRGRDVPVERNSMASAAADGIRRSVFSDGGRMSAVPGPGRMSLNLVPEEHMQQQQAKAPLSRRSDDAMRIERWIEMNSSAGGVVSVQQEEDDRTLAINIAVTAGAATEKETCGGDDNDNDKGSDTTAAPPPPPPPPPLPPPPVPTKRQVSKLEGELLARALLLNVPFCETSAKTGENVEEAFRAIVRAVLREMGEEADHDIGAVRGDNGQCYHHDHDHEQNEVDMLRGIEARGRKKKKALSRKEPEAQRTANPERDEAVTMSAEDDAAPGTTPARPTPRRRGSVMERLKVFFTARKSPTQNDLAVLTAPHVVATVS